MKLKNIGRVSMIKESLVSVIIPVYNCKDFLYKSITSVTNQSYDNLEIILINDGSSDGSGDICNEFAAKDERVKVIHKDNGGVSSARNAGLDIAAGDFVFFMDADDFIDANIICNLVKESNDFDIIKSPHKLIENDKIKNTTNMDGIHNNIDYINIIISGGVGGHCWGYLFKKELISGLYFDEHTSCMEDTLFIISCILKTDRVKYINTSYYNHILNSEGITGSKNKIFSNMIDYLYSLDRIENLIKRHGINLHNDILRKEVILIEKEAAKITKPEDIDLLFNNEQIANVLKEADNIKFSVVHKIFISIILKKNYAFFKIYVKLRSIAKSIKNRN